MEDQDTTSTSAVEGVHCPVCGRRCAGPAEASYTAERAAAHFCPPVRNADRHKRLRQTIERLWQADQCEVYRCGECGFGFPVPHVGGDEAFYDILHEQKGYPSRRWEYDVVAEQAPAKGPANVLDIGAGDGAFLMSLDSGWQRHATEGGEDTRRALEAKGIGVFRDMASAKQQMGQGFELVTAFQVLEHISDFRTMLNDIRELLVPGGQVFLSVPDGEGVSRLEKLVRCPDMPPNHVNRWTPRSLAIALRGAGLEPGEPILEPASARTLVQYAGLAIVGDVSRPGSIARQIYRIHNRKMRIPFLLVLRGWKLLRLMPHWPSLYRGRTLLISARAPQ